MTVEYLSSTHKQKNRTLHHSRKTLCHHFKPLIADGFLEEGYISIEAVSPSGKLIKRFFIDNIKSWNDFVSISKGYEDAPGLTTEQLDAMIKARAAQRGFAAHA